MILVQGEDCGMDQQLQMGLFLLLSAAAVIAALGVIFSRNAVHSALALLANFIVLAVLYLLLDAQFIAAIQVMVYAGAIVVLFLFVVMLLGAGGEMKIASWLNWRTGFVVATLIGTALFDGEIGGAVGSATPEQIAAVGQTQAIGAALFTDFLLPFELTSVLLLVGLLGAVVLGQHWHDKERLS
jgi:NADH-quinone oxidoreductase subunit J